MLDRVMDSTLVNSDLVDRSHEVETGPASSAVSIDLKRCIDITLAGLLLIPLSPVLCGTLLTVKLSSKGPVIFWSERVGRNGSTFKMPKVRTMEVGSKLMSREIATESDVKVTKIGNYLRKTSLDEIPQLWSVLKGDMSLIGPRPLIVDDIAGPARSEYPEIYDVRPGITGLAQIKGRNAVGPRQKARYDAFYARRTYLRVDLWLAVKTIKIILNTKIIS